MDLPEFATTRPPLTEKSPKFAMVIPAFTTASPEFATTKFTLASMTPQFQTTVPLLTMTTPRLRTTTPPLMMATPKLTRITPAFKQTRPMLVETMPKHIPATCSFVPVTPKTVRTTPPFLSTAPRSVNTRPQGLWLIRTNRFKNSGISSLESGWLCTAHVARKQTNRFVSSNGWHQCSLRPRVASRSGFRLGLHFDDHHEHPADRFERKRKGFFASTVSWTDRFLSTLPYLVPLLDALIYGRYVFEQFPILARLVLQPLWPLLNVYRGVPFLPLIIFVLLLAVVVRNPRASYFVRFNTMQALTLDIALILPQLFQGLGAVLPFSLAAIQVLQAAVFYGMLGCILYVVQSCGRGRLPDRIPLISEAAHTQTLPGP